MPGKQNRVLTFRLQLEVASELADGVVVVPAMLAEVAALVATGQRIGPVRYEGHVVGSWDLSGGRQ